MQERFEAPPEPPKENPKPRPPRDPTRHVEWSFEDAPKKKEKRPTPPDVTIDLDAPDAIEKLERLQDALHPTTGPDLVSEASEEVTPEDEAELEKSLEASKDDGEKHAIEASQEAARHLYIMHVAGYEQDEIERAAGREAEKIAASEAKKAIRESERMTSDEALKRIKEFLARLLEADRARTSKPGPTA
jgi:hypothetical protein